MAKKIVPIDYTSRDFSSIRRNLIEHARRYYPTTFKDFNKAGFGSMMLDSVAYVGDVLSYYLDYQSNESFMETAAEYQNVIKHSRTLGYDYNQSLSSYGLVEFFVSIPARAADGTPDLRYLPTIKAGSQVSNDAGATFTLLDDIMFNRNSRLTVSRVDAGGATHYTARGVGRVISGVTKSITKRIGGFQKFLKVNVVDTNIAEILSVVDSEGNEYFEVSSLSQEVIYKPISNPSYDSTSKNDTTDLLRKVAVPRRYTVEHNRNVSTIQFGHGSPLPDISGSVLDPSNVIMRRHAKTYYSDSTFDPVRLTNNDKMGIAPANTTLSIRYRQNTQEFVNASAGSIKNKVSVNIEFENQTALDPDVVKKMVGDMIVTNSEPITGDISLPTVEEIKLRSKGAFASQSRAVTAQDYVNMTYSMPAKFGAIKRCSVIRDADSFKRNINLYVIAQDESGNLQEASRQVKNNLKLYLDDARMINDTVDILDAFVFNFGVNYDIVIRRDATSHEALLNANNRLKNLFEVKMDIGEPIYLGNIYSELKKVPEILDVTNISIVAKNTSGYYRNTFDVRGNTSTDGRVINLPVPYGIFELRYPNKDIKGTIV